MRKALYIPAVIILLLILVLTGLSAWKPGLYRVLRYQNPGMTTYKIFPQTIIHPADSAFHFIRDAAERKDLDTLHVTDGNDQLVPFSEYFDKGKLLVFIVIRNDSVIYERTAPGYSDSTVTTLFSVGKSMASAMLGKALQEGKIKSLDDLLITYVPELQQNPAFSKLTIRHLLTMTSGLEFREYAGNPITGIFSDEAKYYYTEDIKKELAGLKSAHQPGTDWQYRSIDVLLLTWAIENATGMKAAQYFQDKIWKQIGTEYAASFGLDHPGGIANTASRFQASAIDLAKVGRLYLNKGNFNGRQVLPADWVSESVRLNGEHPSTVKYWQKATNHYLWWVPQLGENGDYSAEGTKGQRLYVDPLTNTIIVQLAAKGDGDYPYRKISRYLSGMSCQCPE